MMTELALLQYSMLSSCPSSYLHVDPIGGHYGHASIHGVQQTFLDE